MNKIEAGVAELQRSFEESAYPADFLAKYDQLECLAHSHGTETFFISDRSNGALMIAKCYDKQVYTTVSESKILSGLRHAGLPAYLGSFENDRACVTVREYVNGMPLDRYVMEHGLSEQQAVDICVRLCDILSYLHGQAQPVIHRDVKPQNVIVGQGGRITLIDFDIARQYNEHAEADTQFFGTRVYAPPEQYGFSQTDCRTDIYSLGILLRFLLTGSERERPDKPLPKPLKRIVDHCTAFSPRERYKSAEAVKQALLRADGRHRQKTALALCFAATAFVFLCGGFAAGRYTPLFLPAAKMETVVFGEPLIEAAARVQLGKGADEPLTAEELEGVHALHIFGTEVAKTREPFEDGLAESERYTRGGVASLNDLAMMPNLEEIQIAYQDLADISGLAPLKNLVSVNFMHTRVSDVSVLAGKQSLLSVNLYETNVSDVSCLNDCKRLEYLELGGTLVTSLDNAGGFDTVTELSLIGLKLETLDGIERYTYLESLNLTNAEIGSLDALKELPALKQVTASGGLYERLTELFADPSVSVIRE